MRLGQGPAKYFSVKDGVIDGKGTGKVNGQLLVTDANYGDFRIIVSSDMVLPGGTGHLGVCFRADERRSVNTTIQTDHSTGRRLLHRH